MVGLNTYVWQTLMTHKETLYLIQCPYGYLQLSAFK
jgi:hypothetical protein